MRRGKKSVYAFIISLFVCLLFNINTTADAAKAAVKVRSIKLSKTKLTLEKGSKYKLKVKSYKPKMTTQRKVTYKSGNKSVAGVNEKGIITAKKNGTADIIVRVKGTKVKKACKVNVITKVKSIKLNQTELTLEKGSSHTLGVNSFNPVSTTQKTVTYQAKDTGIAKVNPKSGMITAIGNGTTQVTAQVTGTNIKAVCTVHVVTKVTSIQLDENNKTIGIGSTYQINAIVSPSTASNQALKYIGSSPGVATVTSEGLVKALTIGETTIDVVTEDGSECKTSITVHTSYATPSNFDTTAAGVNYATRNLVTYYSDTTGTTRSCYVLTPADYSDEKEYPVLYLLHGIGGTHDEWLYGSPDIIIGNLTASGEAAEMIVVLPNVRASANDSVPKNILSPENIDAFDNFIHDLQNDLMPFIEENYSVSTKREDTAIAGLSMGGREALFIGFKMQNRFDYIGAFSPAPGLLPYEDLGYPGQFQKSEFCLDENITAPKVILICNGESDGTIGDVPTTYHETLIENGVEHSWYTMPGDHDFTVWKNGLYNFIKAIFK